MHALFALALLVSGAFASIYVTQPVQSTTCTGGQSCLVQWMDDGQSPLLSTIGECDVGLYTGELQLVQSLPSVDVSTTSSFSFTPDPAAGPNGQYYIVFTASSISYQGFSASFTLSGMSGTTPGGGSSTTPGTTPTGSSTSAGSTTPGTSTGTNTASTPSGTTPATTPTLTTPTVATTPTSGTPTSPTTTKTTTSASSSVSPTTTNAAGRVGSSMSFGSLAVLFVLSGALAF